MFILLCQVVQRLLQNSRLFLSCTTHGRLTRLEDGSQLTVIKTDNVVGVGNNNHGFVWIL